MIRGRFVLLLLISFLAELSAQRSLIVDSFYTPSLDTTRRFAMLLPDSFVSGRTYPVLYLLHGYSGSYRDWYDRTDVRHYVDGTPLIVVFPDADNSWYVDAYADPGNRYEHYLMDDLFTLIEDRFPVDPTKRAIAGLSMGGYGALLYGLKYPARFAFAGSFSGAFIFPRYIGDTLHQPLGKKISENLQLVFGPKGSHARSANDVYTLFSAASPGSLPYMYLAVGIQDGFRYFLPGHRFFADSLRSAGIGYEYHETPGRHSWEFWDRELRRMLIRLRERLEY